MRAAKSTPPPGGNGTSMRTGFVGHAWAVATSGTHSVTVSSVCSAARNMLFYYVPELESPE